MKLYERLIKRISLFFTPPYILHYLLKRYIFYKEFYIENPEVLSESKVSSTL